MPELIDRYATMDGGADNADIEIKPCPFCGGKAEKSTFISSAGIYVYRVYCPACQIGTMKHYSMKRACGTWNRRAYNEKP